MKRQRLTNSEITSTIGYCIQMERLQHTLENTLGKHQNKIEKTLDHYLIPIQTELDDVNGRARANTITDGRRICDVAIEVEIELRTKGVTIRNLKNTTVYFCGGGGFAGSVINAAQDWLNVLALGWATVGTDTGHPGHPLDASWALNNLERVVSFGHQAVHRTAVNSKPLIEAYYGKDIARSLFYGHSWRQQSVGKYGWRRNVTGRRQGARTVKRSGKCLILIGI